MTKVKTAVLVEKRRFEICDRKLEIQPDEVLIKIAVCGLCNWELNHFNGILGEFPMTLGHEWAGEIVEKGKDVKNLKVGDKVAVLPDTLEGFAEYGVAKEKNCFLVNPDIDVKKVLLEPLKCIVTVLRAAAPEAGDFGVITGCGPMGLWCIQAMGRMLNAGIAAVDVDDRKLELAQKYGASCVINGKRDDVEEKIKGMTKGHMADFVIEGTGRGEVLAQAAGLLRNGQGRLALMSYHSNKVKEFDFRLFSDKAIKLLNPHPAYSPDPLDDARRAMELINRKVFQQEHIITHRFRLEEIQKVFETLENKPTDYVKGVVYM